MKLLASIVIALGLVSTSLACRCLRPDNPCQGEFTIVARITGLVVDPFTMTRQYTYQLIEDITVPAPVTPGHTFTHIRTGYDYGSCRLDLEVGRVYLLAGTLNVPESVLTVTSCNYHEEWPDCSCEFKERFVRVQEKCREMQATRTPPRFNHIDTSI